MLQQKSDQAAAIYSKCTALSDRLLTTTTKPSSTQGASGAGWCVAWLMLEKQQEKEEERFFGGVGCLAAPSTSALTPPMCLHLLLNT